MGGRPCPSEQRRSVRRISPRHPERRKLGLPVSSCDDSYRQLERHAARDQLRRLEIDHLCNQRLHGRRHERHRRLLDER
jgi:hypothetical protein